MDSILHLAREKGCRSLAIPSISSGAYGFPKDEAYHIATGCIRRFLYELPDDEDMMVYLVLFDQESVDIGRRLDGEIRENIAETYPNAKKEKLRGLFGRTSNRLYPEEDAAAMAPMPMPTAAAGSALSGMAEPAELLRRCQHQQGHVLEHEAPPRADAEKDQRSRLRRGPEAGL